jgi:hypothetical protein
VLFKDIIMSKSKLYIILLTLIGIFNSMMYSQDIKGGIYGKVLDGISKKPLPFVNVILVGTKYGAISDTNGYYKINSLPVGSFTVQASLIGYNPIVKTDIIVNSIKPAMVDLEIEESNIELQGVEVMTGYFRKDPYELVSVTNFGYEEIRRAPGGLEDVVRAVSILPGVAQADAGRNDLIVRGGAPSENLYIVDGIVVPNINHFGTQGATGGPLSYINLDFVKETSFSTGGFSSLYGDKLSSVLKIDLREGRKDRLGGKATISATQFGLNLEGPLSANTDFVFSARRSYLDFIFKAAGFGFVPEYYDVMSKVNYRVDSKRSLSFLFIGAFDNVKYFNDTEDKRYNNSRILGSNQQEYLAGLVYKSLFDNGFYSLSLNRNYFNYDASQRDSLLNPIFLNQSKESEDIINGDFVFKLSATSELNVGAMVKYIRFKTDVKLPFFKTTFGETLSMLGLASLENYAKLGFYTNYSNKVLGRLHYNVGLRLDYFNALNKKLYFSPRYSMSYMLSDLTNVNFSTGIYYQTPSYIWLQANEKNRSLNNLRVDQYVLGFDHRLRDDVILKVEGFYKDYKDYPASETRRYLVLANTGAGYSGSEDNYSSFGLEPLVSAGKGLVKGVELSLQKKSSDRPHYGIFSLTYSKSNFTALDGVSRIGKYDQTWIVNLGAGYIFNERWEASVKFRYSTGSPYTPFNPDGTQSVENYNTARTPENHSLDLRFDRKWNFQNFVLITYIDVQNVYNRKNSSIVRWDSRNQRVADNSAIGILPSIGVSLEM